MSDETTEADSLNNNADSETVLAMKSALSATRPRSIDGLIALLRQAFVELVPWHEGTERYTEAIECQTYRTILTVIQALDSWRDTGAEDSTPAKPEAE